MYNISYVLIDPRVWNLLKKRFIRPADDVICDVYDGKLYRSMAQHLLNNENPANVSLLINTDGVQIFKSSKYSLWPIWLLINELPPSER